MSKSDVFGVNIGAHATPAHVAILGGLCYVCFLSLILNVNMGEGNCRCLDRLYFDGSDFAQQGTFGNVW